MKGMVIWGGGFVLAIAAGIIVIDLFMPKGTWWGSSSCFFGGVLLSCFLLWGLIRAAQRAGEQKGETRIIFIKRGKKKDVN